MSFVGQLSTTDIASIISTLQTDGLSSYLSQGVAASQQTAVYFGYIPQRPAPPVKPLPSALDPRTKHFPHLETAVYVPGQAHLVQVSCRGWALAGGAMLVAALTIGAMVSGGVLLLAGWGAVAGALSGGSSAIGIGSLLLNC